MAYAMHETHTFQPFGRNRYAIVHPCSKRAFLGASFVDFIIHRTRAMRNLKTHVSCNAHRAA